MKWFFCPQCQEIVKKRFHLLIHVIAASIAEKILQAEKVLRQRRPPF